MTSFDPIKLAAAGVQRITPYQPGKPIEELEAELGISGAIKLASNENPLGPSPAAQAVLSAPIKELHRYPDGGGTRFRRVLADHLKLDPAQITLGNGSNDVLEFAARVFAGPGDEILFSQHAFAVYPLATLAVGATPVIVPAKDWGHDLPAMANAISERTRVVFIANPNNPTGSWLNKQELRQFMEQAPDHLVVVVDEAYFEYVDEAEYPDARQWLPDFPNLIVTRTFSKIYGLAGIRAGYGLSSPAIADLLNRVRQPFNMNLLAQEAAIAALNDHDFVVQSRQLNHEQMQRFYRALDDMSLSYIPSVGNFVSIDVGREAAPVYQDLLQRGVIVRPVANYEMPNHLRVTLGLEDEMQRMIDALRQAVQ